MTSTSILSGSPSSPKCFTQEYQIKCWTDDLPICHLSGVGFATNKIYKEDGFKLEEHELEDRSIHIRVDDDLCLYGVFDGHHGSKASDFAHQRLPAELLLGQIGYNMTDEDLAKVLHQGFLSVENGFKESIDDLLAEKTRLNISIPENIKPHEIQTQYPEVWKQSKELDLRTSGGTTAVVGLIVGQKLHIANTGCSRALLCKVGAGGILTITNLSNDHSLNNIEEKQRLEALGINISTLAQTTILGDNQCTRTIGDHILKSNYRSYEVFRSSTSCPLVADPSVSRSIELTNIKGFLALFSAGVWKTVQDATGYDTNHTNAYIIDLIAEEFKTQSSMTNVAQAVVDKIVRVHHNAFMCNPERKELCRRSKDMTLLVRNFGYPLAKESTSSTSSVYSSMKSNSGDEYCKTLGEDPIDQTLKLQNLTITSQISNSSSSYSTNQSDVDQQLFMSHTEKNPLELDENGRVKPYVSFDNYFHAINALNPNDRDAYDKQVTLHEPVTDFIPEEKGEDDTDDKSHTTESSSVASDGDIIETDL